jgi:hypothetical protein
MKKGIGGAMPFGLRALYIRWQGFALRFFWAASLTRLRFRFGFRQFHAYPNRNRSRGHDGKGEKNEGDKRFEAIVSLLMSGFLQFVFHGSFLLSSIFHRAFKAGFLIFF